MKKHDSASFRSLRLGFALSGLLTLIFGGLYFFNVSAQTETGRNDILAQAENRQKTETQSLVNGKIAFTRRFAGPTAPDGRIIIANPDGSGGVFRSAGNEDLTYPAWSPDGTKLVTASVQQNPDLYVVNADGSGSANITNTGTSFAEFTPSWSSTGKIAYARSPQSGGGSQIWTVNPDGTGSAQFTAITQPNPEAPAWSPDGSKLAFVSSGDVWVINADGTNERRVTTTATSDSQPDWSPDGSKIVFTKSSSIAVINLDGTNETTVAPGGSAPSWSPDGTKIAFTRGGIVTMDPNGANQVRIVTNTSSYPLCCDNIYESPTWQPVAQTPNTFSITGRVSYNNLAVPNATVNLTGSTNASTVTDAVGNYQFSDLPPGGSYTVTPSVPNYLFTPANRALSNLTANLTGNNFEVQAVCVTPNRCVKNGKVAFVTGNEILTINPDGTNQINITNNSAADGEPNFSPLGASIAFSTNRDGNYEIYRMNSDGSNPVRLTNDAAADSGPFYSPDGASIVFTSTRDGNSEIYKMNADGSNPVRLTNDAAEDYYPAVSPDGQKIIFISRRQGNEKIFSMNFDGTNQALLSEGGTFAPCYDRPSYSPDGSKIIFSFSPDCGTMAKTTWTMNSNGTNRTQSAGGRYPIYSADGTKMAYVCCYGEPLYFPARLRVAGANGGGSEQTLSQTPLNYDAASPAWQAIPLTRRTPFDYDGDGRADISVFRPSENRWYILQSSTVSPRENFFGAANDIPVPSDYDGDGKTDPAIFRPSTGGWWYLSSISSAQINVNWGQAGDVPRPSDFDGDGKTDFVVYRPSNNVWYRYGTSGATSIMEFGASGDKPLVGDFDGDGKSEPAIFRPSTGDWWYAASASNNHFTAVHWGQAGDIPVPGDFDADGRTDFVVYRPSNGGWYIFRTGEQNYTILQFGIAEDKPVAADFDGDGRADVAVFRPSTGTWYLLQTTAGFGAVGWGTGTDIPTENAFLP